MVDKCLFAGFFPEGNTELEGKVKATEDKKNKVSYLPVILSVKWERVL